uniref:hypothetical protein n=2 Tax=Cyanobium sp. TaxID=2164130 RepID=UPI0040489E16
MTPPKSPLSEGEMAELEATLLPALERHHLRLLAHGLRTLQAMPGDPRGAGSQQETVPDHATLMAWALQQEALAGDLDFASAFADQLLATAHQLEAIAQPLGRRPLALDLTDLITWATASADNRLAIIPPTTPLPGETPAPQP